MRTEKEIEKRRNYLIDENIKLARKINNTQYGKEKNIAIFCEHNKMIKTLEWVLED